jgi:hypothetical protein
VLYTVIYKSSDLLVPYYYSDIYSTTYTGRRERDARHKFLHLSIFYFAI